MRSNGQERRARHKNEQINYSTADRINSWIPEPSPIPVIPVIGKPLTPPINFRDDFQSWIDDLALKGRDFTKKQASDSSGTTPLVQRSPPTPETTPPRINDRQKATASTSSSRNPSDSRTNSFRTAREDQSSDDESPPLVSPSLHSSKRKWIRETAFLKHKSVGLGLGLESGDDEPILKKMTPGQSSKRQDFNAFDGAFGASRDDLPDGSSQDDRSSSTAVPSNLAVEKRPQIIARAPQDSPTLGQDANALLKKSPSLGQKFERSRHSPPRSSKERYVEQSTLPLDDEYLDIDTMNNKRLSQASATSTIVEAMVINSPPRRRQTLRRTGKMADMNAVNTTPSHSNRNSSNSADYSVRRRLRKSKSPDQELRKSFASDTPESFATSVSNARQENGPVIRKPEGRPSLHSSASGSKHVSRTFSFISHQQSSRPTTAPEEPVSYFDVPPRRDRRTMSVVIHPSRPSKPDSKLEIGISPPTQAPNSTPSVPTNNGLSRTTSVTSAGMHTHSQTPADQHPPILQLSDPPDDLEVRVDRITGEWSAFRPRSTLVTPFSLRSAQSSTPGTLEVSEATAISIYPHTNKSILVIQQMAGGKDSSGPREHSAIIAGNANIALPRSVTPIITHESPPRGILHSPLQNPRDPPQPPDFKIIPPTPANAPRLSTDTPIEPNNSSRSNRFSVPITSLKRAFSARRQSESVLSPFSKRTFSLRGTTGTPRRRQTSSDDPESKLHPFWRPRGFWDDVDESDSDSEFGNTGYLTGSRRPSQATRDTTPRRTMSLTRRLTGSLRLPHQARRQRRLSISGPLDYNDYGIRRADPYDPAEEKARPVPQTGYPVQFVGFRAFAENIERRREAREEGKREERRRWLRRSIGVIGAEGGGMRESTGDAVW